MSFYFFLFFLEVNNNLVETGFVFLFRDGGLKRGKVKDTFKEEQQKIYSNILVGTQADRSRSWGEEDDSGEDLEGKRRFRDLDNDAMDLFYIKSQELSLFNYPSLWKRIKACPVLGQVVIKAHHETCFDVPLTEASVACFSL